MERSERTARAWRCLSSTKTERFRLFVWPNQLLAGKKLPESGIVPNGIPGRIDHLRHKCIARVGLARLQMAFRPRFQKSWFGTSMNWMQLAPNTRQMPTILEVSVEAAEMQYDSIETSESS